MRLTADTPGVPDSFSEDAIAKGLGRPVTKVIDLVAADYHLIPAPTIGEGGSMTWTFDDLKRAILWKHYGRVPDHFFSRRGPFHDKMEKALRLAIGVEVHKRNGGTP